MTDRLSYGRGAQAAEPASGKASPTRGLSFDGPSWTCTDCGETMPASVKDRSMWHTCVDRKPASGAVRAAAMPAIRDGGPSLEELEARIVQLEQTLAQHGIYHEGGDA